MTVYVDDMRVQATVGNVSGRWSHLFSDESTLELESFAYELGLNPKWIQNKTDFIHYDVVDRIRNEAIKLGAKPIAYMDIAEYINKSYMRAPIANT